MGRLYLEQSGRELSDYIEYEIFGRVAKSTGPVVPTFVWSGKLDEEELGRHKPLAEFTVTLQPGVQDLVLVVKHTASGRVSAMNETLQVPEFEEIGAAGPIFTVQ